MSHRIKETICKHSDKRLISKIHKEFKPVTSKKTICLKKEKMTWTGISQKKIYKWPISTGKMNLITKDYGKKN